MRLLATGEVELKGRMPWSSNGTFLVGLCIPNASEGLPDASEGLPDASEGPPGDPGGGPAMSGDAIYKPARGERPLWDFPGGLYRREVAAYRLSIALGWGIVPPTVVREDAPLGPGSLQLFVGADFSEHYFTLLERPELHPQLRRIAVFDLLANNADRKSGHCLLTAEGHIWGIDHGVCFHEDPKLRTVIWDFAGERIEADLLADVARLVDDPPAFDGLLTEDELAAFGNRLRAVLDLGRLPEPLGERPYPWPLV